MKTYKILFATLFCFMLNSGIAQNKIIRVQSESIIEQSGIGALLHSKNFEFSANSMFPMGQAPKNIVGSGYSVTFSPEKIISYLPFYGRAYSGMAMNLKNGMQFSGVPEIFTVVKTDNHFEVTTRVKSNTEIYKLFLTVNDSGAATLIITTNRFGTIKYNGEVLAISNKG